MDKNKGAIIAIIVGLLILIIGIVLMVMGSKDKKDNPSGSKKYKTGKTLEMVGGIMIGVGALVMIASGVMMVMHKKKGGRYQPMSPQRMP